MGRRHYLVLALALASGGAVAAEVPAKPANPGASRVFVNPPAAPDLLPTIPVGSTARGTRTSALAATEVPPIAPWVIAGFAIAGTGMALYYNGDGGNSTSTSTSTATATAP